VEDERGARDGRNDLRSVLRPGVRSLENCERPSAGFFEILNVAIPVKDVTVHLHPTLHLVVTERFMTRQSLLFPEHSRFIFRETSSSLYDSRIIFLK